MLGMKLNFGWTAERRPYSHDDARKAYEKAIGLHPQNLRAYRYLAFELRHLDRLEEAEQVARQGLVAGEWPAEMDSLLSVHYTTDEIRVELWRELGLIYADSSHYSEAANAFKQTIQLAESLGISLGLEFSKRCLDAVLAGKYDVSENRMSMDNPSEQGRKPKDRRMGCMGVVALILVLCCAFLRLWLN
jgi:tetratricopeptide (TPR) repeat protein